MLVSGRVFGEITEKSSGFLAPSSVFLDFPFFFRVRLQADSIFKLWWFVGNKGS